MKAHLSWLSLMPSSLTPQLGWRRPEPTGLSMWLAWASLTVWWFQVVRLSRCQLATHRSSWNFQNFWLRLGKSWGITLAEFYSSKSELEGHPRFKGGDFTRAWTSGGTVHHGGGTGRGRKSFFWDKLPHFYRAVNKWLYLFVPQLSLLWNMITVLPHTAFVLIIYGKQFIMHCVSISYYYCYSKE